MPQIDPIFSNRPPGQTTSWIQITRLDKTRPDQTMCFGQTITGDRLRQTRPDQFSFVPQTTQPGQHCLSVSLTLPQYTQPPPSGCHHQLLVTGKVHSLWIGSYERLICNALDESYKTYFKRTFGLKFLDFLFRLYLIIVRVVSGVPWAGKGRPCPFSIVGLLCRYSVNDRSSAIQKQFRSRFRVCSSFRRFNFVVSSSYVIVFNAVSHLVAPNSVNFSVTLNFLVYALCKWSFQSIICFNSKFFIIILKTLLTKTFFWSLQKLPHDHMAKSLLKIMLASAITLKGKDFTILCCLK